MSEEEYNSIKETMYLLNIQGMREKLLEGKDEEGIEIDWKKELNE